MAAFSSFKFIVQSCRSRSIKVTICSSLLKVTNKPFSFGKSAVLTSPPIKMRRFSFINIAAKLTGNAVSSTPASQQNGESIPEETYETAVRTLNTLQSNAATLAKSRLNRDVKRQSSIPQTIGGVLASGLTLSSIDNLPIIHISGTKGKGMTCAFTESILRQAGLKTGFFSSPHLTAVRERIRINGTPLSESHFTRLFFSIYHKLKHLRHPNPPSDSSASSDSPEEPIEMPHYFRFLLIMALHAFLEEAVDVVILEVGIGGKYDTTNFISKPICVGITSLGLEHQSVLGSTLEEIALQKAGIMKPGSPAFTLSGHSPNIEASLRENATSIGCPLEIVEPFKCLPTLGVDDGGVARLNASLAIHLANYFLRERYPHIFPKEVTDGGDGEEEEVKWLPFQRRGLELTRWDGRFQILEGEGKGRRRKKVIYHLDGAHTPDSLEVTLRWFGRRSLGMNGRSLNLLVFNLTGDRDCKKLMGPLVNSDLFDLVIFCPFKIRGDGVGAAADTWSALEENGGDPLEGCRKLKKVLEEIGEEKGGKGGGVNAVILESAEETVDYVKELGEGEGNGVKVLVTGSLHLVGCFLSVLQPNRNDE